METGSRRTLVGTKKCNRYECDTCPFLHTTEKVKSSRSNFAVKIKTLESCESYDVVYCISCNKPSYHNMQYIGETGRRLADRFRERICYVKSANFTHLRTGNHFNLPGHTLSNMKVSVLEKCKENNPTYREIRESYFINQFNTTVKGLNKKR